MSEILIRRAVREDLDRLVDIETVATPSVRYIKEVAEEFYDPSQGELIVAEIDGIVAGFAHYSIQYDNSAWIETLRVDPPLHRRGAGAAIWERIMELCDLWKPPAIRMYTTVLLNGSIKLAHRCGLDIARLTHEYELDLRGRAAPPGHAFERVPHEEVKAVLEAHREEYGGYYCTNRTFYAMNDPLYDALFADGKVWRKSDAVAVVGSRYRHETGLHVGMLCGNVAHAIEFAVERGLEQGVPKVVCMIPNDRQDLADALREQGFRLTGNDIIMMERIF